MTVLTTVWYTSGTFWSAVSAFIGIAGMIVAWRVAVPYRRLTFSMPVVAQMIRAPDGLETGLEVRHPGGSVQDPYVVEVHPAASGQRDIPSTAFDRDAPLRLDVHVPIVNLLKIELTPETVSVPMLKVAGTVVEVPPCRIDRRQHLTITMVVDCQPKLTCKSPLVDVDVRPGVAIAAGTLDKSTQMGGHVVLLALLLAAILSGGDPPSWVILAVVVIGLLVGVVVYLRGRRDLTGASP